MRLREQCSNDSIRVERIDFEPFITDTSPLSAQEVLAAVVVGMAELLRESGSERAALADSVKDFLSVLDIKDVEAKLGVPGFSLKTSFSLNGNLRDRLLRLGEDRLDTLTEAAHAQVATAKDLLLQDSGHRELLLILDGLEKAIPAEILLHQELVARKLDNAENRDARPTEFQYFVGRIDRLFNDSRAVFDFPCHVVVTAPPSLYERDRLKAFDNDPVMLTMVKIHDMHRVPFEPGEGRLTYLVESRHPEVMGKLFAEKGDPQLLRLVRAAGGLPRDLVALVRSGIQANLDDRWPIPEDVWDDVLRDYFDSKQRGVFMDLFPLLRKIDGIRQADPGPRDLRTLEAVDRDLAMYLLDRGCVLGYRNGEHWYDLHPSLWDDPRLVQ